MMMEDKLTHDERLRLECVAQAVVSLGAPAGRSVGDDAIVRRAAQIEAYVREGKA